MGFADFIKGIFSKEPEVVEEISMKKIDEWFNEKVSSRKDFLNGQLAGIKAKTEEESKSIKQKIETLRNAQLRNTNIPEKAKHFMEGNRNSYIKWTEQFLENLRIPENADNVDEFLLEFKKKLEEFSKLTIRPYKILSEFFEEEASGVASGIKKIDSFVNDIREALKKAKLKELKEVKEFLSSINNKKIHKQNLGKEISKTDERVGYLQEDNKKLEKSISEMQNSTEYKDYKTAKHKLEELKKQSSEKEAELAQLFSSLERPMKKYVRVVFNDKDMLEKYIESPINALSQDFGFKVISIFSNMRKAIEDNSLELKDKQKQKALQDIGELSKDFLSKFIAEYAQIKKKENDLLKEIKSFDVIDKLKTAKEKLHITSSMLEKAKSHLDSLGGEIGKIDIEAMEKELIEKIKSKLEIKAVIS